MTDDQKAAVHRQFAVGLYNATWDLLERPERSSSEDRQMLASAFASRFHWASLERAEQTAIGDWMIANVASRLGLTDTALMYAAAAVAAAESNDGFADHVLASSYEGLARAHACAGNTAERDRYVELSKKALERIAEDDDRQVIEQQLRSVPGYR